MLKFFLYIFLSAIFLLGNIGCVSEQEIYGSFALDKNINGIVIITPKYALTIPGKQLPCLSSEWDNPKSQAWKANYTVTEQMNSILFQSSYWFVLRNFLFIPYKDSTVWYLGFIPIDGVHIVFFPKLSEEETLEYLIKKDIDYDNIRKLPIVNTKGNRFFLIQDNSLPDIMVKAMKKQHYSEPNKK